MLQVYFGNNIFSVKEFILLYDLKTVYIFGGFSNKYA